MFITFEGIDGSGKTTLATKFVNFLKNNRYGAVLTAEPTRLVIGKFARDLLALNTNNLPLEVYGLLLAADRIHHIETVIKPELKNKRIVEFYN